MLISLLSQFKRYQVIKSQDRKISYQNNPWHTSRIPNYKIQQFNIKSRFSIQNEFFSHGPVMWRKQWQLTVAVNAGGAPASTDTL